MRDFSKGIKQLRLTSGLTQDALAEQLHVTRQAVSNWENGKTQPDLETLQAITEICGGDLGALLGLPKNSGSDYITGQRKYGAAAAVCGIILLVGTVLHFTLLPKLQDLQATNFDIAALLKYQFTVLPLCYLALGWLILSLLSLKLDLRPARTVRILCAVGAVVCLFPTVSFSLFTFLPYTPPFWTKIYPLFARHMRTFMAAVLKYLPLLSGAGTFFAFNH